MISEVGEVILQSQTSCLVELVLILMCQVIFPWRVIRVILAEVYLGCGDTVAYHFCEVAIGNFDGFSNAIGTDILPIFGVMLVATFVMKPSG